MISETETILIVKKSAEEMLIRWCPKCQIEAIWIAPAAFRLLGISGTPAVRGVHMIGDNVCLPSLIQAIRNGDDL